MTASNPSSLRGTAIISGEYVVSPLPQSSTNPGLPHLQVDRWIKLRWGCRCCAWWGFRASTKKAKAQASFLSCYDVSKIDRKRHYAERLYDDLTELDRNMASFCISGDSWTTGSILTGGILGGIDVVGLQP